MKNSCLILLLSLLFTGIACQSDEALESIQALEAELEANPDNQKAQRLLERYQEYVSDNPTAHTENAELLYKGAALSLKLEQPVAAMQYLEQALTDHYAGSRTTDNALLLASIYEAKLGQPALAAAVYRLTAEAFPSDKSLAPVRDSLLRDIPPIGEQLDSLKVGMYNERTGRIDARLGERYARLCQLHALLLPAHPDSPNFLYEGGKIAGYVRAFPKAITLYQLLYQRYPGHDRAGQALFMTAFTYDSELGDTAQARPLYLSFLEQYPSSDFADDAAFLLDKLGLSDEEIIQRFENAQVEQ